MSDLVGVELTDSAVVLAPLTATVIRLPYIITEVPDTAPTAEEKPTLDFTTKERTEESVLPIAEEVRYDATLAKVNLMCFKKVRQVRESWFIKMS